MSCLQHKQIMQFYLLLDLWLTVEGFASGCVMLVLALKSLLTL